MTWTDSDWRAEVLAWIDDQLLQLGQRRAGDVAQPHVRPFGRAFAWERVLSGVSPEAHGEYAGAVGEWLLELFEPTVI